MRIQDKATPAERQAKQTESVGKFLEKRRVERAGKAAGGRNSPQATLKLP